MLKTAGKSAVSGILCLLLSRVYYFSSYLQQKVAPSLRPQGGNVPLSLGVWGKIYMWKFQDLNKDNSQMHYNSKGLLYTRWNQRSRLYSFKIRSVI